MGNIIVTGKSGAGKQPRIDVLIEQFGYSQLSTGNIFRTYLSLFKSLNLSLDLEEFFDSNKNDFVDEKLIIEALQPASKEKNININEAVLGLKATRFVDGGLFVPDSITNQLFAAAFKKQNSTNMILDGYPRTIDQAKYLVELSESSNTKIDFIMLVENENEAIISRTIGRRICTSCGKVFHMEFKPPKDGKLCTACGSDVKQRSDDTVEKIRKRLNEFENKTKPTIEYLVSQNIKMVKVPGNLPVFTDEAVRESVLSQIKDYI
jgi:adenylate kinase